MDTRNSESDQGSPQDEHFKKVDVTVVDQDHPNFPYHLPSAKPYIELDSNPFSFGQPVSHEGFSHNDEAHRNAGRHIAKLLDLPHGSKALDIGWGRNSFVADGLQAAGLDVSLIDYNSKEVVEDPSDPLSTPPVSLGTLDDKFHNFAGNIADISHPSSVLKETKFDLAIFNGSWLAGGYNCTVSESLEGRLHEKYGKSFPGYEDPRVIADLDEYRGEVLSRVKDHVNPGGFIYVGSSRFAYHGAGYEFGDYPKEKLSQLDLMAQMTKLGARKIMVIGVTNDRMRDILHFNLTDPEAKAHREEQIIGKLIFPSLGGRNAEFQLTSDGKKLTFEELRDIAADPEKRANLLQNPGIADRANELEEKIRTFGEDTLSQLTGGVSAIPDKFSHYDMLIAEKSQRIKRETEHIMPRDIARIDALAFQF